MWRKSDLGKSLDPNTQLHSQPNIPLQPLPSSAEPHTELNIDTLVALTVPTGFTYKNEVKPSNYHRGMVKKEVQKVPLEASEG